MVPCSWAILDYLFVVSWIHLHILIFMPLCKQLFAFLAIVFLFEHNECSVSHKKPSQNPIFEYSETLMWFPTVTVDGSLGGAYWKVSIYFGAIPETLVALGCW